MSEDNQFSSKTTKARENAIDTINKHNKADLSKGEYAHELISETYINLISQAQSGMCLSLEGQMLDVKISKPRQIINTNTFLNGYRIGRYAINY